MTSILFVDSHSIVGKNVYKNVIERVSFVELCCTRATHFAALEWCGSAVASGRPLCCSSQTDCQSAVRLRRAHIWPPLLVKDMNWGHLFSSFGHYIFR